MRIFLIQLLTMSAAASIAALLVMVLRFPLKKAPRWLTCALWLVVLVRMVCPAGLSLPVSLIPSAVSDGTAVQQVLSVAYANGTAIQQNFSHSGEAADTLPIAPANGAAEATPSAPTVPSASEPVSVAPSVPADTSPALSWSVIGGILWAAGCFGMLLWGVVSYARWKSRISDAILLQDNIYETDRVDTPFVWGILRPRIVLPVGLSPADRPYVLLHEQAHIRRRDYLTKPLAFLALCVHWFNPVLWISYILYCRDVETACDEAVLRSFGREDTAGYASALLHLGRAVPVPKAVPLAFGETNAKRRIDDVIRYRKPRIIVCCIAVVVCLLTSLLLLANPGTRGNQLEGVAITECCIWDGPLPVEIPEDLRDELVHLLKQAGNDGYVKGEFSLSDMQKENAIVFSDGNRGTEYWLLGGPEPRSLVRNNHDTYTYVDKPQQLAGLSKLASMPAYADWWSDLQDYLHTQRADELYDLKTPYIGDVTACGTILNALNAQKIIGPYTVELHTAEEPYGITLHAEGTPGSDLTSDSFTALSSLFYALVDNAETFDVVYEDLNTPRTLLSGTAPEDVKNLSKEEFRSLYRRSTETAPLYSYWSPVKALYLAPTMYDEVAEEGMSVYAQSAFAMDVDRFTAHVRCVYSSANPETETYWWPVYESHPVLADGTGETSIPLLAPDGAVVLDTRGRAFCNVNDTDGFFTGYRFYYPRADELNDSLWMAHFTEDGELEYLFRLQQKQGIVTPGGDFSAGYDNTYLSSKLFLTAGDRHHMTLSLTMPDVQPESYVGGPLSWCECSMTAVNTETGREYLFCGGEHCYPSNLSLKDGTLTAEFGAVTTEALTSGEYDITLTAIDLIDYEDGDVVSPGIFLWKGIVTLGDSPAAPVLSALSPEAAPSDKEAIEEAVTGAFNARIQLGSFFSEDGTTAGFSEEQLAEMNAAYTKQVRTYYSKTYAPYWEYPQENEQALSRGFFVPAPKTPLFMLFDTGVLSCDIKRLSIDSENRTATADADVVTWSNAIWSFEAEGNGIRYRVSAGCGKAHLTNELVMEDGRWKVSATKDLTPAEGTAPPLWSRLPWLTPSHLANSKDETVAYCAKSLLDVQKVSQTDYETFEEALTAARNLDVINGSYYSLWQALNA